MTEYEPGRERPRAAERAQEVGAVAPGRGGRMSRQRKTAAVIRLLRGEDLEAVSRARGDSRNLDYLAGCFPGRRRGGLGDHGPPRAKP